MSKSKLIEKISSIRKYPFQLDDFQLSAINSLLSNSSVFVSAHTSAGKTAIAEFIISLSLKNSQRLIYTTPIKALSNQKFKDFRDEFGDVGLITGDTQVNPEASILVCTTEILRNMLYKSSPYISEAEFIVFDEVHYMRDKERGTVWEESIILLKEKKMLFLSATLENSEEFSDWISELQGKKCAMAQTDFRPVPLKYYLYAQNKLHAYYPSPSSTDKTPSSSPSPSSTDKTPSSKDRDKEIVVECAGRNKGKINASLSVLIRTLLNQKKGPVLIFRFSRKECDESAMGLTLPPSPNRSIILEVFSRATSALPESFRISSMYLTLKELLSKGVGVHHSGLIPVLKEVVELLFGENLLDVLLATETFAMGVNMPARTVVFGALSKWDGNESRLLTPGEFTQMAGRAGRRGLDTSGTVVILGEGLEAALFGSKKSTLYRKDYSEELDKFIGGKGAPLDSSFRLTYNMVLNMCRIEDPYSIIKKSFRSFQEKKRDVSLKIALTNLDNYIAAHKEGLILVKEGDVVWLKGGGFGLVMKVNQFVIDIATYMPYNYDSKWESMHWLLLCFRRKGIFISVNKDLIGGRLFNVINNFPNNLKSVNTRLQEGRIEFFKYLKDLFLDIPFKLANNQKNNNIKKSNKEITENSLLMCQNSLDSFQTSLSEKKALLIANKYLTEDSLLLPKGRVAAEISTVDEILVTEALFSGLFGNISPSNIIALLGILLDEDYRIKSEDVLCKNLISGLGIDPAVISERVSALNDIKKKLGKKDELKLNIGYIVLAYINDKSLEEIAKNCGTFEGTIARIISRVNEVCNEISKAAENIGNDELKNEIEKGIKMMKKGVIFAGSLYM